MSARQYFCCCIPVRIAVFVTSLLALLFSGAVAGISFFLLAGEYTKDGDTAVSHLSKEQKIALGVVGGVYTVIALASLFGFIGAIIRKRGFVRLYSTMTFVIFFVQCAASGYLIYSLFRNTDCTIKLPDGTSKECTQLSTGAKVGVVCVLMVHIIVQAYIVSVIRRYVTQLEDEQTYRGTSGYADAAFRLNPTSSNQKYQPVDQAQGQGLLHPQGTYAYADPHHSFGHA
ncbi:hypothetical protein BU17DRAFT_58873 [Hysterangium stoloniferum]|nr:hypothetical protein BU17DRAFT_58873 [Hysterangium stoloniferum]